MGADKSNRSSFCSHFFPLFVQLELISQLGLSIFQQQNRPLSQMLVGIDINTHIKCPLGGWISSDRGFI